MNQTLRASSLALALSIGWIAPAHAAAAQDAQVQAQLAAMQTQLERLNQRLETLEGQLEAANARVIVAEQRATAAVVQGDAARVAVAAAVPAPTVSAKPATDIAWDGAPRLSTKDGWSFKPRGRVQIDAAGVNAPDTIPGNSLGFGSEFRRVYLGFDGTMPGGFGYRVEADMANGNVDLTDVYLTYKASPQFTVTVGQHKPFQSMEDMTSDLFSSFTERAAFNSAFGFERRVGVSGTYVGKAVLVQAGVFTDNAADLSVDTNNSYSFDGRAVFMPKLGSSQLHLGGSYHVRDFNDAATTTRYRARPFAHTTDLRLVNTGNVTATGETAYGLEAAYIAGRFHATAESSWMRPHRPGLADPTFNGGYAELGYLLTADTTAYKAGVYDRIKPKTPLGKGGIGAVQLNLRYDWLDLNDGAVIGGRQQMAGLGLTWIPTDYVRFLANYGRLWIDDAAVAAGTQRKYQADAISLRAQIDF